MSQCSSDTPGDRIDTPASDRMTFTLKTKVLTRVILLAQQFAKLQLLEFK
jgi:hypothetical protein